MTLKYGPNLAQLIGAAAGDEHYQAILSQWRALDALVQAAVLSRVTALPTTGVVEGDRYLFIGTGSNANRIARYREANTEANLVAGWEYFTPREGWSVWSVADSAVYRFKAGAWSIEASGGSSGQGYSVVNVKGESATLALADGGTYIRATSSSAVTLTVPPQTTVAWTENIEVHVRAAGSGSVILAAGTGVTLNRPSGGTLALTQGMTVTLKRVAIDAWDVIGQTVAA